MKNNKNSNIITPEFIETIAKNPENLKALMELKNENIKLDCSCFKGRDCCCPRFLQFNFLLCNVYIKNDNAECD